MELRVDLLVSWGSLGWLFSCRCFATSPGNVFCAMLVSLVVKDFRKTTKLKEPQESNSSCGNLVAWRRSTKYKGSPRKTFHLCDAPVSHFVSMKKNTLQQTRTLKTAIQRSWIHLPEMSKTAGQNITEGRSIKSMTGRKSYKLLLIKWLVGLCVVARGVGLLFKFFILFF